MTPEIKDLASHLASLISIMDFHEDLGTTKHPAVVAEFDRAHDELVKKIKEHHDEARKSEQHAERPEAGANPTRREPWRGGPVGAESRDSSSS